MTAASGDPSSGRRIPSNRSPNGQLSSRRERLVTGSTNRSNNSHGVLGGERPPRSGRSSVAGMSEGERTPLPPRAQSTEPRVIEQDGIKFYKNHEHNTKASLFGTPKPQDNSSFDPDRLQSSSPLIPVKRRSRWVEHPHHHSRSEYLQERHKAALPHLSYDLDGDGVVGHRDMFLSSIFDQDKDGVLNENERAQAEEFLRSGAISVASKGSKSALSENQKRILAKSGLIVEPEELPIDHPQSLFDINSPEAPRTRSRLLKERNEQFLEEAKRVVKNIAVDLDKYTPSPPTSSDGYREKPRFRTAKELARARRKEFIPHPSFDLDGDGVVSQSDHYLALIFDKDGDGRLNKEEYEAAMDAKNKGIPKDLSSHDISDDPYYRNLLSNNQSGASVKFKSTRGAGLLYHDFGPEVADTRSALLEKRRQELKEKADQDHEKYSKDHPIWRPMVKVIGGADGDYSPRSSNANGPPAKKFTSREEMLAARRAELRPDLSFDVGDDFDEDIEVYNPLNGEAEPRQTAPAVAEDAGSTPSGGESPKVEGTVNSGGKPSVPPLKVKSNNNPPPSGRSSGASSYASRSTGRSSILSGNSQRSTKPSPFDKQPFPSNRSSISQLPPPSGGSRATSRSTMSRSSGFASLLSHQEE